MHHSQKLSQAKPNYWEKKSSTGIQNMRLNIITWNAVVKSSVFANNLNISTKAIPCQILTMDVCHKMWQTNN